jgi:hypothetical protein
MLGNSNIFRGLPSTSGRLVGHWRFLSMALMLALTIAGASLIPRAQAAPAGELVNFSMKVENPKTTLCPGETVTYFVQVEFHQTGLPTPAAQTPGPLKSAKGLPVFNVKVEASTGNKNVGDFVGTVKGIATAKTIALSADDDELAPLEGAKFKFKATKPGKTNLYFEGAMKGQYVSLDLPVEVVQCSYKVRTILRFNVQIYTITVTSNEVLMTSDKDGNYRGSNDDTMQWVYSKPVGLDCTLFISATNSKVNLTGALDREGKYFAGNVTFDPTMVSVTGTCPHASGSASQPGSVSPLTFKVPSSGGVSKRPATATGISGRATIVVVQEK